MTDEVCGCIYSRIKLPKETFSDSNLLKLNF